MSRARFAPLLEVLWIVLLILPAATTASATRIFDANENGLFIASCWIVLAARLLFPRRAFFLATLPVALAGVACMLADFLRGADLLALALQWRTFPAVEVIAAARPYAALIVGGCVAIAALGTACWFTSDDRAPRRGVRLAVGAVTLAAALVLPATTWLRAWPIDGVLVAATSVTGSRVMAQYLFPASSTLDPRDPGASWHAARRAGGPARETVVFVVGETIRNDYLSECHGPAGVRPLAAGALVACDVTAGSDGTDQSVPLLVSREMPGHPVRVSDDATVMRALGQAGFETWWITAQAPAIAWPDAEHVVFPNHQGLDTGLLLPPLAQALAAPARLKAVLLHANNAHDPYCVRYDAASAPYPSHCANLGAPPDATNLEHVKANYANAVDASVGFVDGVIAELDRHPEPAFLVFSPDHGENLLDDGRAIWGHARRHPTRWDAQVPAVFWANAAWRAAHPTQWATLRSSLAAPLMHADLVPTLLDAADVAYTEPRALSADLLRGPPPARQRVVQTTLGATIAWNALVAEARVAGPPK